MSPLCTRLTLMLCFLAGTATAETPLPGTPAGQVFREWLSMANRPDRQAVAAFVGKYHWSIGIDEELTALQRDGGYATVAVEQSEPDAIAVRVRTRADGTVLVSKLDITHTRPVKILFFGLYEASPTAAFTPYKMDPTSNRALVGKMAAAVRDMYFDAAAGERIAKALAKNVGVGTYDGYSEGELLAQAVNDELRQISHDQHLNVLFYLVPPDDSAEAAPDPQQVRIGLAKHNCGFVRAEHLAPNIGYLKLDSFALPDVCGETANAAMRFIADSDAIIFDLRDNGGGVPAMVSYLESFLFDKSTHLNDVYYRKDNEVHQFWTLPFLQGKHIAKAPVYVLTSKNTFSAAEEFAYTLQSLKRATVVGETTAGGAHPYDTIIIDSHFTVEVPFARSINPVTKRDWEGTGVVPDVTVSASDALERAITLAKSSLGSK